MVAKCCPQSKIAVISNCKEAAGGGWYKKEQQNSGKKANIIKDKKASTEQKSGARGRVYPRGSGTDCFVCCGSPIIFK